MPEMQSTKSKGPATQRYLNIAEIKENTVVLKDGSLRAIIAVSSTNFALKSEDEQNALMAGYQNFLNSIDFSIQILIHSRVLDINGYLEKLRGLAAGQTNELLRIQMNEYIEYVGKLVELASIMNKTFYVIVPFSTAPMKQNFLGKIGKIFNPAGEIATTEAEFEKNRVKLEERTGHVIAELGSMGLRSLLLNTAELTELVYQSYNFDSVSLTNAALEGIELEVPKP